MQPLLKDLVSELHQMFFKHAGFSKKAQRFRRRMDAAMEEVEFQSSQWNSRPGPITFYVNLRVGFSDIPARAGASELTGFARIPGLVPGAPPQYDLTQDNYEAVRKELLEAIPSALDALKDHYDDVRFYAHRGSHCVLPIPASWRTEG